MFVGTTSTHTRDRNDCKINTVEVDFGIVCYHPSNQQLQGTLGSLDSENFESAITWRRRVRLRRSLRRLGSTRRRYQSSRRSPQTASSTQCYGPFKISWNVEYLRLRSVLLTPCTGSITTLGFGVPFGLGNRLGLCPDSDLDPEVNGRIVSYQVSINLH